MHGEAALSEVTGIPQKTLQKIRQKKLVQGEDWDVGEGLRVAYCAGGVVLLLELATNTKVQEGCIAGVALAELLKKTNVQTDKVTEEVKGKVCRLFPNPYLVEIELTGGKRVLVRVRETKNLRRGMEVPLRAGKGPAGLELARRLPRFPGKW